MPAIACSTGLRRATPKPAMSDRHRPEVPPGSPQVERATRSLLPPVMRTVRFRLTLLYSVMLFGLASMVVGGMYWGLSRSLEDQISQEISIREGSWQIATPSLRRPWPSVAACSRGF